MQMFFDIKNRDDLESAVVMLAPGNPPRALLRNKIDPTTALSSQHSYPTR